MSDSQINKLVAEIRRGFKLVALAVVAGNALHDNAGTTRDILDDSIVAAEKTVDEMELGLLMEEELD